MRVLYITNIPSPYRIDFFNALGKRCDLTVLFERKSALDREDIWLKKQAKNFKAEFLKGILVGADSALCMRIVHKLKRSVFDIVVVGGYSTPTGMLAICTLKLKRIPFVLNCDGGFIKNDSWLREKIKRFFIKKASWWLSSGQQANLYLEHYGADIARSFYYPLTSLRNDDIIKQPIEKEQKTQMRTELGLKGKKIVLGVGQFIQRKGFDTAIQAWVKMPSSCELVLIGNGSDKDKYAQQIKDNRLSNVTIIGFQDKQTLQKYYRSADIFLMSTREDIWGLVINEAMAQGLPILSTDAALAARELIVNLKNGIIIQADDADAIANNLTRMLDNEDALYNMSLNNLETIKEYTIENMVDKHVNAFESIYNRQK